MLCISSNWEGSATSPATRTHPSYSRFHKNCNNWDIIATFVVNNTPIYSSWSSSFSFLKENMTFLVDLDILLIEAQNPCDSNQPGLYSRPYSCASILHGLLSRSYNELSRLSLCQVLLILMSPWFQKQLSHSRNTH